MENMSAEEEAYIASSNTAEEAVSRWWECALRNPVQDNGSPSAMMDIILSRLTNSVSSSFANVLEKILAELNVDYVDVDYNPCRILSVAAVLSSSKITKWPWKSYTRLTEQGIVVAKYGYGSPEEEIWRPQQ